MSGAGRARLGALAIAVLAAAFGVSEAVAPVGAIGGLPLPVTLLTVTVTPVAGSIEQGATLQYDALGTFSDLSTRDITNQVTWSSSSATVATISNTSGSQGVATAAGPGAATITATDPTTGTAGTAVLTVNPIAVPPVIPPVIPPVSPPPGPPEPTTRGFVLTPDNGRAASAVHVAGWLFPAGRAVRVSYRTGGRPRQVKVCRTSVRGDGTFTCPGFVPGQPEAGAAGVHDVVAKVVRAKGVPVTYGSFTMKS